MTKDNIIEGYNLLLCLAIHNCALVLDNDGDPWKEAGLITGRDMNSKYIVNETDLKDS